MKASTIWNKRWARRTAAVLFWLAVWALAARFLPHILFAGPVRTALRLLRLLGDGVFWLSIASSFGRITLGFLLAAVLGCACAALCRRFSLAGVLLEPAVHIMKSVPVACFIVVALIWVRSAWISVLTAFFVVFPLFYVSLSEGLRQLDPKMLEMARVFHLSAGKRFRAVYLPGLTPHLLSTVSVAVGMALKTGVAGELIGLPARSIGEQLYLCKLYLETDGLFAWTAAIVLLSVAFEKLLVGALAAAKRRWEAAV